MKAVVVLLSLALVTATPFAAEAVRKTNPETWFRAPNTMHGKTVLIPIGTTLEGRVDQNLGSSISHDGDSFAIIINAPVLANGTDVIIASGSQILGEVVEAIPANQLPKRKDMPKPTGKLRVQITGLKTPDGQVYPMVASLTGELIDTGRGKLMANTQLGGGYGYMGSTAGFDAVAPGSKDRSRPSSRGPKVMKKEQMAADAIYGLDRRRNVRGKPVIRSLVQRGRELYIDEGSPLTVRLDAPLKIGFNPPGVGGAPMSQFEEQIDTEGKRFSRNRREASSGASEPNDPLGLEQPDTAGGGNTSPPPAAGGPPSQPGDF